MSTNWHLPGSITRLRYGNSGSRMSNTLGKKQSTSTARMLEISIRAAQVALDVDTILLPARGRIGRLHTRASKRRSDRCRPKSASLLDGRRRVRKLPIAFNFRGNWKGLTVIADVPRVIAAPAALSRSFFPIFSTSAAASASMRQLARLPRLSNFACVQRAPSELVYLSRVLSFFNYDFGLIDRRDRRRAPPCNNWPLNGLFLEASARRLIWKILTFFPPGFHFFSFTFLHACW